MEFLYSLSFILLVEQNKIFKGITVGVESILLTEWLTEEIIGRLLKQLQPEKNSEQKIACFVQKKSPKHKDIQFAIMSDQEKNQTFTSEKLVLL